LSSSIVYTKPTKEQKEYFKQKSVVENTHLSINSWLKKFENYRKTVRLAVDLLDQKQFPYLLLILDGKLKELVKV
ncbi:3242_t:CDS:2, partial [Funneliformis mosseae]